MMHINYLQNKQKTLQEQTTDFYTSSGIHVFVKDLIENEDIDLEDVINTVESMVPKAFMSEVEMILVGDFEEFRERHISAAYKDGALYVSNTQLDEADMIDDIVHEIGHSIEEPYGYELYYDQKIKNEFLQKRERLHSILWGHGFKTPKAFFNNTEYDEELDNFLFHKVGYDKLTQYCLGLFINAYAPTSLREYFATGFTDYFMRPDDHGYLKETSPELYKKINDLYMSEKLDNTY